MGPQGRIGRFPLIKLFTAVPYQPRKGGGSPGQKRIECFLLTPMTRARRYLRRYQRVRSGREACLGPLGYHDARRALGEIDYPLSDFDGEEWAREMVPAHGDPIWPSACDACGEPMLDDDGWQARIERLFERSDGGEPITIGEAWQTPGAMHFADWYPWKGPDGRCLVVVTPGGPWIVDRPPERGGSAWSRSGEPPRVTASPSILFEGKYHGWLTDGVLSEV